jgi:hypothetical protein
MRFTLPVGHHVGGLYFSLVNVHGFQSCSLLLALTVTSVLNLCDTLLVGTSSTIEVFRCT